MLGKSKSPEAYKSQLLSRHRAEVEEYELAEEAAEDPNSFTFQFKQTAHLPHYRPCTTRLSDAKPISLKEIQEYHELGGDNVFVGRVLLCTTLDWPFKMTSIMTVVEDDEGRVERLALYNFAKDSAKPRTVMPKGAMLAILDPFYKGTMDGGKSLRVDNPQTVIFFSNKDELIDFKRMKGMLKATIGPHTDRIVPALPAARKRSADELKAEGNEYFQRGRYEEAISCYTQAINASSNEATKTVLLSNRSECYLRRSEFRTSLIDAVAALETDPLHVKSKHRKCKALVGLRKYTEAAQVLPDHASNADLDDFTKTTLARALVEQTGKFDIYSMIQDSARDPLLSGHADYTSEDFTIAEVSPSKGRGGIATKNIPFGTIIMASKAAAISFETDENEYSMHMDWNKKRITKASQNEVASELMRKVMEDSDFGPLLYDLYAGPETKKEKLDSTIVDIERIRNIVSFNAFSATSLASATNMTAYSSGDTEQQKQRYREATRKYNRINAWRDSPTGLWIQQSYLNHSCNHNCTWFCVGDYMFVITCKDVKKDEELTVPYVTPMDSHYEREEALQQYGFRCECERCVLFRSKPHLAELEARVEKKFESLREAVYTAPPKAIVPILDDLVSEIIRGFGQDIKYTACHFITLTAIVNVLERGAMEGQKEWQQIIEYSKQVSEIAERFYGKGDSHWVMSRTHQLSALIHCEDKAFIPLVTSTCQAFLSLYHTSLSHFQKSFLEGHPILREIPLAKLMAQSKKLK